MNARQNLQRLARLTSGPIAMIVAATIALTATFIYSRFVENEAREGARLEAIAESRAREIGTWLRHHLTEAEFMRSNPRLYDMFRQWQNHKDRASLDLLLAHAIEYRKANEYSAAMVLDASGEIIAHEGPPASGTPPALKAAALKALATGQAQRTAIYRLEAGAAKSHLDFVIPLTGNAKSAQGIVVLRVDPDDYLLPLLRQWPVKTSSGESVLVRREGDRIINMSKPALNPQIARVPASEKHKLLLLRATQDENAIGRAIAAIDSLGTPVFGVARRVAGSDWVLVSRINRAEFDEVALTESVWIGLGGLLLCIAIVALGTVFHTREALARALAEKNAQAARINALELLEAITESSDDAIFAKDRGGRYLIFNDKACRIVGRPRTEVIGRDDTAIFPRAQATMIMRNDARVVAEDRTIEYEETLATSTGKSVFHATKGPIHNAAGEVIGMYGISRDITRRKRDELMQREQGRILEMIAAEAPAGQTLETIARSVEALADDVLCSILLLDDTGRHLRHAAAPSLPEEYNRAIDGLAIGPGVGSCGSAAFSREAVFVEDILTHPHWRNFVALAAPLGLRACWSTPVFDAQRNLLGTLALYRRSTGAPTEWHQQLISMATHVASICVSTARARSALVSSEARYRSMVAALTEGLMLFDGEGRVLAANPAAERMFGMSEAEIIERWRDPRAAPVPIDEDGRPVPYESRTVRRAIATGEAQRNVVHGRQNRNGQIRWNIVNAEPMRERPDGPVTAVIASYTDITARHATEQELRKLSLAVEQSFSSIIITDADARIEYVNDAFCRVSGYTRDELLGRNPRLLQSGRTPKTAYEKMWGMLTRGEAWTGEFVNRRKNGEEFSELVHISPIRQTNGRITHYLGIREDITERKRIGEELEQHRHHLEELVAHRTQALRESREFIRTITDNVPGLVSYWDSQMRCRFANKAYAHWWGRSPDSMIGHTLREILPVEQLDAYEAHFAATLRGEPQRMEHEHPLPGGEVGYTWAHCIPDVQSDTVCGFYVLATDITDIKLAELRLQELNDQLTQARDKADAANKAKSAFLANMSHEIRTPMNAIIGLTHLLQRDTRDAAQQDRLSRVADAAHHLLHIINDILDLSKIESGKLTLETGDFSLDTVLSRVSALVSDRARAKGLELVVAAAPLPDLLHGDAMRLTQALLNLLGNAVKFTERGSVTLTAEVLARADDELQIRFAVRDTGIGIAAERIPFLFNAFEQADGSITRRFGGTGLGLAITRHIATLMGGEAGVESRPGAGSTFWFTARLRIAADAGNRSANAAFDGQRVLQSDDGATAPVTLQALEAALRARAKSVRVLLAEDNPVNQEVAVDLLNAIDIVPDLAENGHQALAMAKSRHYDLVLMDVQMPGMDGMTATREIRCVPGLQTLPVLAMTANAFEEDRQATRDAGMNDHVAKPVDPRALYAALLRWLPDTGRAVTRPASPQAADAPRITPAPATAIPAIAGIDTGAALANIGGRTDGYLRLLRRFADTYRPGLGALEQAIDARDAQAARRFAHSLKGAAAAIAANALRTMAATLESAFKAGDDATTLAPAVSALKSALAETVAAIDNGLRATAPRAPAAPAVDDDSLIEHLDALLATANFESVAAHAAATAVLERRLGTAAGVLAQHIRNCDFSAARAVLRTAQATEKTP